ncbi:SDR family NAD(P)-dependent oxidoreductase [Actinokineospora sp. UTMC 2448]|uniref:SDR family NAD(P)-dependent oxidoreductase n=1 Tax=Actinokineospora sp. UTMC 2448 TaxID=2268449 RepID=UPI0021645C0E|nr:SDR family NAD(P)-dependent oxidoreductase [Actinokineospora sp. UTMC 2448]UVS77539.1 2-(R)-hydroxypropyl-CoM dehydrogenase [Actinokineospora sp. UTMC 2448]
MSRVLVTGAGSGLGAALARGFAARGDQVLVTDVDGDAAKAVADGIGAEHRALDVTTDDWAAAREWCAEHWGGLDVLVNNAGVGSGGRMERIPLADWDWIWDINVRGVVRGCAEFIPVFKEAGAGHLVNIASLAAIMNLPGMASYNVTKAGVLALSETLRHELRPYGITTTVVCPGFFQTNLNDRLRTPDPAALRLSRKLMASATVTADDVAARVIAGVAARRFLVHTHRDGRRAHLLKRLLPGVVDRQVAKYWARIRPAMEK